MNDPILDFEEKIRDLFREMFGRYMDAYEDAAFQDLINVIDERNDPQAP